MKTILFVNTLYYPDIGGGAEIVLQAQAEGLRDNGYNIIILATKESGDISFDLVNDIKVYRAGIKNRYWPHKKETHNPLSKFLWHLKDRYNIEMMQYLQYVIDLEKPDLIICHNLTGWTIAVWDEAKRFNIPVFQVLHDQYLLCLSSNMFRNGKICQKRCFICGMMRKKFAIKSLNVDAVIGVSKFILDKFIDNGYFLSSDQRVIYNRVRNDDNFSFNTNINTHKSLIIGYIGSLHVVKGVDILIKAFRKTKIEAKLLIAGKGEATYEKYLKDLASSDKRITFLGYTNPYDFYPRIDLLVVPSVWNEPLGLIAIEACAHDIAVIASKRGGLPEIIKDGINGLIINPDEISIYNAILYYAENPPVLKLHKNNARKSIQHLLKFELMINEYEDLINSYTLK